MSLASKIAEIRKARGIGIDELSEQSGVPKGTLAKISAGITTNPSLSTIQAIASALSCKLDDFDDIPKQVEETAQGLTEDEQQLIDGYRSLSDEGREKALGYIDDLVQSGKYVRPAMLYRAARSKNNAGPEIIPDTDGKIERFKKLPKVTSESDL